MTLAATNLKGKCQISIGKHFKVKQFHIYKFLVRLHGEYNILVKLCGNTT